MYRTCLLISIILSLLSASLSGQEEKTAEKDRPKLRESSIIEVRDAITEAVLHLRLKALKDIEDFFVPPKRTRQVVGREEYVRRYRRETYEKPVYEYEYETYTTMVKDTSGESVSATAKLKKVTKRRRVGRKQVGTKEATRLVPDPDGPIKRKRTRRIRGPGGPDVLRPAWYGQNAMAVYLMLRAGVDPHDNEFRASITDLANYTEGFGLPDRTWELAWLTAAFVNLPKDDGTYKRISKALVNKLLVGQIDEGAGEGMWGPVCIDPELVAALIKAEQELRGEHIEEWQERIERRGDRERYREKLEEGKELVDAFIKKVSEYSPRALDFGRIKRRHNRSGWQMDNRAKLYGLPLYIYGEITADMESTALALFAIREAQENNYLPEHPVVQKGLREEPVMQVKSTERIILEAVEAIAERQKRNGIFDQGIVWQAVKAFEDIGLPQLPVKEPEGIEKESEVTLLSTAQGYIAFADAVALLNGADGKYRQQLQTSARVVKEMTDALVSDDTRGLEVGEDEELANYEFAFAVGRLLDTGIGSTAEGRELWWKLVNFLMEKQDPETNIWLTREQRVFSPSVAALMEMRAKVSARNWVEKHPERAKKHKDILERKYRAFYRKSLGRWGMSFSADTPPTVYSALLLLQGARPPVVGVWSWHGKNPRTRTIDPVLARLRSENGVRLNYIELPPALPVAQAREVKVLFASGAGGFEPAAADAYGDNLTTLLTHNGILVAEGPANEAGEAFLGPLQQKILELLPGGEAVQVPAGEGLPEIAGVRGEDGRLIAAFIRLGPSETGGAMAPRQAMQFLYNLLQTRMDKELLNPDYAIDWKVIEEAENRLSASTEDSTTE